MMLCNLPPEIIIQIFSKLSPDDLSSCKTTNKYLYNIIEESHVLQYCAALILASAEDNPCSDQLVVDKLHALKSAEKAWSLVQPQFTMTVPVTHQQSGVYDLTGGVYLLSNSTRTILYYIKLPTKKEDVVVWKKLEFTKTIIDIGLCLFEHDLIVVVTTTPHVDHNAMEITYDIELEYLQFSTGKPHPLARKSSVLVMNSQWPKPAVGIEIVGHHLVLILSYNNGQRPDDRVYIYDWRNDVLKMSFLAPYRSYSGLIFLTEHLILIPNVRTNALDIFEIPEKPTADTPVPVLVLRLPELAEERLMGGISCRAEPNPIGSESSLFDRRESRKQEGIVTETVPGRGFLARAEEAICIFEMRILVLRLNLLQGGWNINFQPRDRFSFIVHRNAFVDLVKIHGKKDGEEHREASPSEEPMEVQQSSAEPAESQTVPSPAPTNDNDNDTQVEEDEDDDDDEEHSEPEEGPDPNTTAQNHHPGLGTDAPSIPWAEWGPPVTRWFNSDTVSTRWITISAGQRCVRMEDNPPPDGHPYTILDFNPANVVKMKREMKVRREREGEGEGEVAEKGHEEKEKNEASGSATEGPSAPAVEEGNETMELNGDAGPNTSDPDPAPEITETHYTIPGGPLNDDETPLCLGSSLPNTETQEFLDSQRQSSEFQQGSSASATRNQDDDDGVSVSATVGSTSRSWLDDHEDEEGDGDGDEDGDASIHHAPGDPIFIGPDTLHTLLGGDAYDDDDEYELDDDMVDDAYEDAAMDLGSDYEYEYDNDGSEGDTEYGTADMTGFAVEEESDDERDVPMRDPSSVGTEREERIRVVTTFDQVEPADAFAEPVQGGLPYVACDSEESYVFDGVLLDEERVIGVQTDEMDRIEKVEILYFG